MGEEKRFENKVKKYLKSIGAWYLKTFSDGIQRAGIPDLIICYKGKFLGVELKSEIGRVSPLQKYELEEIDKAGGIAKILRPSDFEDFKKFLEKM